jgi:hypothetical protein
MYVSLVSGSTGAGLVLGPVESILEARSVSARIKCTYLVTGLESWSIRASLASV